MDELFYLRDSRSDVGTSAVFWAVDGGGYTSNLSKAWKLTREEAISRHNSRETDIPLRCDLVDQHAYLAVDCQLVDAEKMTPTEGDEIVYQAPKCWDGNNIMFAAEIGNSYNYGQAKTFAKPCIDTKYIPLRKSAIDAIARPVVASHLVPTKQLLRKAKIKMNSRLRASRPTSGKTRGNCPVCGKVAWDYNPYEPIYCKDHDNKWDRL
jgi:hypothetical protein